MKRALDWLQSRTGMRGAQQALLDEPLPPGTGWFFTLGSVLLALLSIQLLTGAFLTLYYAATPDHAYDSVRFIISTVPGRIVRGLHHYGSSFIIVALALHMLRVIAFGSYKAPREATWLSGLLLFALILAFSLTGYLLPWDQRAYWATVVTINISKLTPVAGEFAAALLRGGESISALTLTRWYAVHVIFLPGALVGFVLLHLFLMRRHGISGPVRPREGMPLPFYPWHAARDTVVITVVLVALAGLAWGGAPALEGPADPTDGTYVPRPEWYFLGLFQLLKYFPGRWEVVGAMVVPGLAAAFLALLPWIDRGPARDPRRRPLVMLLVVAGFAGVTTLTVLGWRDRPPQTASDTWTLREIGGRVFAERVGCAQCHGSEGVAEPLDATNASRGVEWIAGHIEDPEMIAPGLRRPPAVRTEREVAALLAYVRRLSRQSYPGFPETIQAPAAVYAKYCIGCHTIDGEGGTDGPDLSRVGSKHDVDAIRRIIADPEAVKPDAEMPSFETRLTPAELDAIATYLASRK